MRDDLVGVFSGMKEAKPSFASNYEREGHYWNVIQQVKLDQNRSRVTFVAFEKVCIRSLDPDAPKPHKPGDEMAHLLMSDKDSFLGNMKSAIGGITGMDPNDVGEKEALSVCADDQPMAGMIIENQNRQIMTKAKKPFTLINYIREVPASEVLAAVEAGDIPEHVIEKIFPNNILKELADMEEPEEGAAVSA